MRRYRIASWIFLILSILNFSYFTPAAPVDVHGLRVNTVGVAKDRVAMVQKRMDPDEGYASDQTSEHGSPGPGPEPEPEPGSDEEPEPESDGESDEEPELESDEEHNWPEMPQFPSDSDSDSGSDSDSAAAEQAVEEYYGELSDAEDAEGDQGHHESGSEDYAPSPPPSPPPPSPGHQDGGLLHSPESQHPAASIYEDLWNDLKGSLRPRTSTSGRTKEAGNR